MLTEEIQKKIGQFFMIAFEGVEIPSEVKWLIEKRHVGGVILFASNCPNVKKTDELIQHLKSLSKDFPLTIAIDHEGGRVHRLPKPFTHFPAMATLGKLYERMPSSKLGYEVGLAMGRELSALGVTLNFAPVLDVNTNPVNPVIGDRSFHSDPEVVARVACQFIQGLEATGVQACGKHFPGHGDTAQDSHEVLPRLPHNRKRLESIELVPFEAAIQQNVASIMTAHVVYDGVDKNMPATFSVKILRDWLREELGFGGVIFSDDLAMGAISKHSSLEESCVKAFLAGCDLLLVGRDPKKIPTVLDYFARAIEEEKIPQSRLEQSLSRIEALKNRGKKRLQGPSLDLIGSKGHLELLNKIKQLA